MTSIDDIIQAVHELSFSTGVTDSVTTLIRRMTDGYCLRPISPARGEPMPQTVEACQAVMERDSELILEQAATIRTLTNQATKLSKKLAVARKSPEGMMYVKMTDITQMIQQGSSPDGRDPGYNVLAMAPIPMIKHVEAMIAAIRSSEDE